MLKIALGIVAVLALGLPILFFAYAQFANPRVEAELLEQPNGERAKKVMLLTLPSGRRIPVNYLREGDFVFAGADGRWWKEFEGGPFPVTVWIRGETLRGQGYRFRLEPEPE